MTVSLLCAFVLANQPEWSVNGNNAILWEGKPYLPVGLRIDGTETAVKEATTSGVKDLLLEVPADGTGWAASFKACEDAGARYIISIKSPPPSRDAVVVDPAGYRLADIQRKTIIDMALPDASEAMLVLATVRDGSIRWSKRVPILNGRLKETVDPQVELPHTLLIFPITRGADAPDFFEGLDEHRDRLLSSLRRNKPGPGFRGIVDPLGSHIQFPGPDTQFVPLSKLFQTELAAYLETKYATVATALQSWGVATNDIKDLAHLSRLVPLWSETRGVEQIWDSSGDRLYGVDRRTSLAWKDIRTVLRSVAARRTKNLIENLNQEASCPVVMSWTGWTSPTSVADIPIDGLAFEPATNSISGLIDSASRPVSALMRRNKPGLAMAVGIRVTEGGPKLSDIVAELESIGIRAWYIDSNDPAVRAEVGKLAAERVTDSSSSEWTITPLYYPESARDPAVPMRLTGGLWWLPAPAAGQRIVFGAGIEGYRDTSNPEPTLVIWSTDVAKKVSFRVSDPKVVSVKTVEGQLLEFKVKKKDIEFELPTTPVVMKGSSEMPVPLSAFVETTDFITLLLGAFETKVNPGGNEQYQYADAVKAFDRTPGQSFTTLRAQLNRMLPRAAPFVWIACSRSPKHNFSEATPQPGSASENLLVVSNRFAPEGGVFYAEYPLTPRKPGSYEVWISARIPQSLRDKVRLRVGEKMFGPPEGPVSLYGDGLGWYKFATLDLPKAATVFRFECPGDSPVDLGLDVIHIALPGFRPKGPRIPVEWLKGVELPKEPKLGKP